jgi:hypothetical protein
MKISHLPLVVPLARWLWSADSEDDATSSTAVSPEYCLSLVDSLALVDFSSSSCLALAVSKGLSVGILVGACFNKAPTVMNMMQAQSAEGISRLSLYAECLFYANGTIYSLQQQHPLTAVSVAHIT